MMGRRLLARGWPKFGQELTWVRSGPIVYRQHVRFQDGRKAESDARIVVSFELLNGT